jgi:hypothetical protein
MSVEEQVRQEQMAREEQLQTIGECAHDSIDCMVCALEVDYDRLEELRDAKLEWENSDDGEDQDDYITDDELEELEELEINSNGNDCIEDAERCVDEDPLSIQVRSGWQGLYEDLDPAEYEILLSTGGPATRIIGELDQYGCPCSAVLQAQDWFTPWTDYARCDEDTLLAYASRFLGGF